MEKEKRPTFKINILEIPEVREAIIKQLKECEENCNFNPRYPDYVVINGNPICNKSGKNYCHFSPKQK